MNLRSGCLLLSLLLSADSWLLWVQSMPLYRECNWLPLGRLPGLCAALCLALPEQPMHPLVRWCQAQLLGHLPGQAAGMNGSTWGLFHFPVA